MTPAPPPDPVDAPTETTPGTDRGISPIAGRLGGPKGKLITLAALAVGCGVFLAASWDRGDAREQATVLADAPPRQGSPFEPARRRDDPPLLRDADVDPDAPALSDEPVVPALEAAPASNDPTAQAGPSPAEQRRALAESARRAPVLVYSRSGDAASSGPGRPAFAEALPPPILETELDRRRRVTPIAQVRAGRLGDRDMLVTAGTLVPCVLQTAMDSATPGYVGCVVPQDVYSESGRVVLMERGTRVLGEYRGGLERGRGRLFVLWTRAVTPTGVAVALASPATDGLGRAGFDGTIDGHFWERFGGALLLSVVDDGLNARAADDRSTGLIRAPSDAASVALQDSLAIPPTLRKAQGAEVGIFVAQDLDFGEVYRLRAR